MNAVLRMPSRLLLSLMLLASFCFPGALFGQRGIVVTPITPAINALSISDLDFLNSTAPKWLFTIEIANNTGASPINVTMRVDISVNLATGETLPNVIEFETVPFPVFSAKTITNLDIGRAGSIQTTSYKTDNAKMQRLKDIALPTGTLPAGNYFFSVTVNPVPPGALPPGAANITITLSNPSSVELIFPSDRDLAVSQFPLFQWLFDGMRSRISIYEQLPGQASLEEVASGVPMLTADVTTNSYQYPSAGTRSLQPGKSYIWIVEGFIRTSGGTDIILKSPLRSFTVVTGPSATSSFLDDLERALDSKYKPLFDQIRADGLSSSGIMRLNGSPISTTDLVRIIQQLRKNPDSVLQVTLE